MSEVECLGACVNAPMVQVDDDFYEDLDYERTDGRVDRGAAARRNGRSAGPQTSGTS
jgi:NADH:ubiquinone oxidoreductase subunit E